jgi:hypothetical protein
MHIPKGALALVHLIRLRLGCPVRRPKTGKEEVELVSGTEISKLEVRDPVVIDISR